MPAISSEPVEQTFLGKYQLIAEIGRGGAATVYLAVMVGMTGFTKLLVVKLLRNDLGLEGEELGLFADEARLAARLNHPNVVQTLEFEEENGRYFLAMEYLEGQPLSRITASPESAACLPLDFHVQILCDTLAGLHHAHELKDYDGKPLEIVHRDVSPHNVFVTYDGIVKLLDFGIAKAADSKTHTTSGALKGKVGYMSPDQLNDAGVDRRTDVFAVGVMLWEAVAKQRMWKGLSDLDIIRNLMAGSIPRLSAVCPQAHPDLVRICDRALAPQRSNRFATAAEFRKALEDYLESVNARVTADAISLYLVERFSAERERIRAVVQKQLLLLEGVGDDAAPVRLPTLALDEERGTSSSSARKKAERSGRTPSGVANARRGRLHASEQVLPRRRWVPFALGAAILIGLIGFGSWRKATQVHGLGPGASAGENPLNSAAQVAPSDARGDVVSLSVSADPPAARLFLDDARLPTNPFVGNFPRDDKQHRLRAEADGFTTQAELISLQTEQKRTISLAPLPSAPLKSARPPRLVGEADGKAKPHPSAPAAAATTVRPIDDKNPFP